MQVGLIDRRIPFVMAVSIAVCLPLCAWAQSEPDPVFDAPGFQKNRDYFSELPFEYIDPGTGSLTLTFTDLVLPGNGGFDLKFEHSYNSKTNRWTFGLSGIAMFSADPKQDNPMNEQPVQLFTSDGATHRVELLLGPDLGMSDRFWKYDRSARILWKPDGSVTEYEASSSRRVRRVTDSFGNVVSFDWSQPQRLTVSQELGADPPRSVVLQYGNDCPIVTFVCLPISMIYQDRTWTYVTTPASLTEAISPVGSRWQFGGDPMTVITPYGGRIEYKLVDVPFRTGGTNGEFVFTKVVDWRRTTDVRGIANGVWDYEYDFEVPDFARSTRILGPDGVTTTYHHGWFGLTWGPSAGPNNIAAGLYNGRTFLVQRRTVEQGGVLLEQEDRDYTWVALPGSGAAGPANNALPELNMVTITRNGSAQTYRTTFTYYNDPSRSAVNNWDYGNFHNPWMIEEEGESARTTTLTYAHGSWPSSERFIVGKRTRERVVVGSENFIKEWRYDLIGLDDTDANPTGFLTSETVYGIRTDFASDGRGNLESATKGGKTTSFTYSHGRVKNTITQEFTIVRAINPDGTIASETSANRTTAYQYDDLSRVTRILPPQGATNPPAATVIAYGNTSTVVTRGRSRVETTLDGFGRPVETIDAVNVRTRIEYDPDGRKTLVSLPYQSGPGNAGTRFTYDGLGRLVKEEHLGGATTPFRTRTYSGNTVVVIDEEGRRTDLTQSAFGDPDDARITRVLDAKQPTRQEWNYTYNGLGQLTGVRLGPGGTNLRSWAYYPGTDLLHLETHPESGQVEYQAYVAGLLTQKRDARNTVFSYAYDNNDRLRTVTATSSSQPTQTTTITYEPGSDNRVSMNASDGSLTEFTYDASGRLRLRKDTIDGRVLSTMFEPFRSNNIGRITYPSGRQVAYTYDNEGRVATVSNPNTAFMYASNFEYHPSGAVKSYRAGNGLTTTVNFDDVRQWVSSVEVGTTMSLVYAYDRVGNVASITEPNRPEKNQWFGYDELDRLISAQSGIFNMQFAYDPHGNRATANGTTYEYHTGRPFHLRSMGSLSPMEYDPNGNLTTGPGGVALTYSLNNLVMSATGNATSEYAYDADDWRVKRRVNGATFYSVRGPNGQLLSEWKNELPKAIVKDYIYAGSRLVGVHTSNSRDPINP